MQHLVKLTGELIEFDPHSLQETMAAWLICKEYIEAYTKVKDQLKPLVESYTTSKGVSEAVDGYIFRVSAVQRYNYAKSELRKYLDEDTLDLVLEPNKTAVDKYLKEHLADLGEASTLLRNSMVATGKPYQTIKAEKISR